MTFFCDIAQHDTANKMVTQAGRKNAKRRHCDRQNARSTHAMQHVMSVTQTRLRPPRPQVFYVLYAFLHHSLTTPVVSALKNHCRCV